MVTAGITLSIYGQSLKGKYSLSSKSGAKYVENVTQ